MRRDHPEGVPHCICANCLSRPVMDRCTVCEECWYARPHRAEEEKLADAWMIGMRSLMGLDDD